MYSLDEMHKSVVEKFQTGCNAWRRGRRTTRNGRETHKSKSSYQAHDLEGKEKAAKARKSYHRWQNSVQKVILDPVFSRWQTTESSAKSAIGETSPVGLLLLCCNRLEQKVKSLLHQASENVPISAKYKNCTGGRQSRRNE